MFIPHWKQITSPLQAQQVKAIYKFVTMVHYYKTTILVIIHCPVFY
jgi:hypothetical protein